MVVWLRGTQVQEEAEEVQEEEAQQALWEMEPTEPVAEVQLGHQVA